MNFEVSTIPTFDRQAKRLGKKYPSLKDDLKNLVHKLGDNPFQGTPLGNNFFKIRLAIASKGRGKSGGARVITFVKVQKKTVYLSTLFDKTEKANITWKELEQIFTSIP